MELPDYQALSRICGTNDCNIKIIESYLGVPVYLRGNLLSVDSSSCVGEKFKFIIERLLDECSDGTPCTSDLVRSVLLLSPSKKEFRSHDFSIQIPGANRKVYPQTAGQADLVDSMRKNALVFATGPAGSGKTFMCVAEALSLVLSKKVNSILISRPVVEAGESLGFLPGTMEEKINPFLRPLLDAVSACLGRADCHKLLENGVLEISPLAYMRGRTFSNCAVILDEAQNATSEQMKMLLTRIGDNAHVFVTGDTSQIDLPKKKKSGLLHALDVLKGVEGIGFVHLTEEDVVRSDLVKRIVLAYKKAEEKEDALQQKMQENGETHTPHFPFSPTSERRLV